VYHLEAVSEPAFDSCDAQFGEAKADFACIDAVHDFWPLFEASSSAAAQSAPRSCCSTTSLLIPRWASYGSSFVEAFPATPSTRPRLIRKSEPAEVALGLAAA
jgi:hypothetical protein